MLTCTRPLALLAVSLLTAAGAQAGPLSYVEGTDLSNTSPGTSVGSLDVGANTVAGSVRGINAVSLGKAGDYADVFSVHLDAGLRIVSWTLDISNIGFGDPFTPGNQKGTFSGFGTSANLVGNGAPYVQASGLSIGAGDYEVSVTTPWWTDKGSPPAVGFLSYVLTIDVESTGGTVPEPGTALLTALAAGMAGVAGFRRRRVAR